MNQFATPKPVVQTGHGKLDSIQALRAVAAFAVVVHHVGLTLDSYYSASLSSTLALLAGLGAAGVDLFFVISGYIIFRSTSKLESGFSSARNFLRKRVLRIYPAYWIWTSVLLLMWLGGLALKSHQYSLSVIAGSYLLIPVTRADGSLHPVLDQGWTLSFEMYFYLVFSSIILLGWLKKGLAWIALPFLLIACAGLLPAIPSGIRSVVSSPLVAEFLLGVCIGWALSKHQPASQSLRPIRWALMAIGAGLFAFAFLRGEVEGTGIDRLVIYGFPSAVLVTLALLAPSAPLLRRASWLGDASYSIYLTHGFFTLALGTLLKGGLSLGGAPAGLVLTVASVAILLISSTAYWLVEKPVARLLTGSGKSGNPVAASTLT
ncbi:hypothetical protein CR156_07485 [Stenotrophomonas lactitubi]|uniref:acyltransferase family protein n=1 Tax=Stenotrophomonas lactitubi TaxID=2045214 RepID=UPI000C280CC2|nr:acyltransferase [Stenotrophomonas lactitubi]PJO52048.1 hypothetical protein CR156_07485 [Stenotrophomonas lactitubi]